MPKTSGANSSSKTLRTKTRPPASCSPTLPKSRSTRSTGHAHYAHVSTGAPPVDYYVDAAGDDLAHVHIQDTDGYSDRHWLPGDGSVRWAAVFRALGRLSSKPRLLIEVKDQANIRRGAAHLEALGLAV